MAAKRGLAALSPERRKEIASMGGRTSQGKGTAHQWTPNEARAAGSKGGLTKAAKNPYLSIEVLERGLIVR